MRNNKKSINSSQAGSVSLSGVVPVLILLHLVVLLKEFCSTFRALFLNGFSYIWGDKTKPVPRRDVTQHLQKEKPKSDSTMESYCTELSLEELKIVMEKLGTTYDADAGKLNEKMGSLEISELFEEEEPSLQEVKEAFCIFDENNDGFIDAAELKRVVSTLSLTVPSELECVSMIRVYDKNGDGVIDFNEFLQLVMHSFG